MESPCANFFLETLESLQQISTVDEFYLRLDNLRNLILESYPWIWERYFLSRFIEGLKHEVQIYVLQHHPISLLDAYELASIKEYSLRSVDRTYNLNTSVMVRSELVKEGTIQHVAIPMDTDKEIFINAVSDIVDDLPSAAACFLLVSDNVSIEGIAVTVAAMQSEQQNFVTAISRAPSVHVPHCLSMPVQPKFSREANIWDTYCSSVDCNFLGSSGRPPPTSDMLIVAGISTHNTTTCRLGSGATASFHPCILWCSPVYPMASFYCVLLEYEFQLSWLGDTIRVTFKWVAIIMCILLCARVVIASHLFSFMHIWNFDALTVASTLCQHHSNIVFNSGTCNSELGSLISKQLHLALRDTLVHTASSVKDRGGTAPIFFAYVPIYVTPCTLSIVESMCTAGRPSSFFEMYYRLLHDGILVPTHRTAVVLHIPCFDPGIASIMTTFARLSGDYLGSLIIQFSGGYFWKHEYLTRVTLLHAQGYRYAQIYFVVEETQGIHILLAIVQVVVPSKGSFLCSLFATHSSLYQFRVHHISLNATNFYGDLVLTDCAILWHCLAHFWQMASWLHLHCCARSTPYFDLCITSIAVYGDLTSHCCLQLLTPVNTQQFLYTIVMRILSACLPGFYFAEILTRDIQFSVFLGMVLRMPRSNHYCWCLHARFLLAVVQGSDSLNAAPRDRIQFSVHNTGLPADSGDIQTLCDSCQDPRPSLHVVNPLHTQGATELRAEVPAIIEVGRLACELEGVLDSVKVNVPRAPSDLRPLRNRVRITNFYLFNDVRLVQGCLSGFLGTWALHPTVELGNGPTVVIRWPWCYLHRVYGIGKAYVCLIRMFMTAPGSSMLHLYAQMVSVAGAKYYAFFFNIEDKPFSLIDTSSTIDKGGTVPLLVLGILHNPLVGLNLAWWKLQTIKSMHKCVSTANTIFFWRVYCNVSELQESGPISCFIVTSPLLGNVIDSHGRNWCFDPGSLVCKCVHHTTEVYSLTAVHTTWVLVVGLSMALFSAVEECACWFSLGLSTGSSRFSAVIILWLVGLFPRYIGLGFQGTTTQVGTSRICFQQCSLCDWLLQLVLHFQNVVGVYLITAPGVAPAISQVIWGTWGATVSMPFSPYSGPFASFMLPCFVDALSMTSPYPTAQLSVYVLTLSFKVLMPDICLTWTCIGVVCTEFLKIYGPTINHNTTAFDGRTVRGRTAWWFSLVEGNIFTKLYSVQCNVQPTATVQYISCSDAGLLLLHITVAGYIVPVILETPTAPMLHAITKGSYHYRVIVVSYILLFATVEGIWHFDPGILPFGMASFCLTSIMQIIHWHHPKLATGDTLRLTRTINFPCLRCISLYFIRSMGQTFFIIHYLSIYYILADLLLSSFMLFWVGASCYCLDCTVPFLWEEISSSLVI